MTTAELIEALREADPTGQLDVVVGAEPVYTVERLPGYYDGCFGRLIRDPEKMGKCHSVVGFKACSRDDKVRVSTYELDSFVYSHGAENLDLSEISPVQQRFWRERVDALLRETSE